ATTALTRQPPIIAAARPDDPASTGSYGNNASRGEPRFTRCHYNNCDRFTSMHGPTNYSNCRGHSIVPAHRDTLRPVIPLQSLLGFGGLRRSRSRAEPRVSLARREAVRRQGRCLVGGP